MTNNGCSIYGVWFRGPAYTQWGLRASIRSVKKLECIDAHVVVCMPINHPFHVLPVTLLFLDSSPAVSRQPSKTARICGLQISLRWLLSMQYSATNPYQIPKRQNIGYLPSHPILFISLSSSTLSPPPPLRRSSLPLPLSRLLPLLPRLLLINKIRHDRLQRLVPPRNKQHIICRHCSTPRVPREGFQVLCYIFFAVCVSQIPGWRGRVRRECRKRGEIPICAQTISVIAPMNCGVAVVFSLAVSSSTIFPMLNQSEAFRRSIRASS
jgi:hypothetical protein